MITDAEFFDLLESAQNRMAALKGAGYDKGLESLPPGWLRREVRAKKAREAMQSKIDIKEQYEHEHKPSIFIMFDRNLIVHWRYSGNELRRLYLEKPSEWVSAPIEVPIPYDLDEQLTKLCDKF